MLKGIPSILHPELLHLLACTGHGDEVAIVDRNFPAARWSNRVTYLTGVDLRTAGEAVLQLLPIDTVVEHPLTRMEVIGDPDTIPDVQREFHASVESILARSVSMDSLPREAFYERVRGIFVTIVTSEVRPYGCIILTVGIV